MPFSLSAIDTARPSATGTDKYRLALVHLFLSIQNSLLKWMAWLLYSKQPATIKNILIFRTGSLGDNICAAPSVDAIRRHFPKASVILLTDASTAYPVSMINVLEPSLYSEIIDYMGMDKKKLLTLLKKKKIDLIIQLPQREAPFMRLLRDIVFFRLIAKAGWGWRVSTVRYFKKTQEKYLTFPNETEKLLAIVKDNGIPVVQHYYYPLKLTAADELFINNAFINKGIEYRDIIAIVVGAQRPLNRWPINYFKEVIQFFINKYTVILIGGKADLELVKPLETIPGVVNFCGQFTPMQSAAALKKCLMTLSNDTGPMHLSYAVGTPVVGLFSSRDFAGKWYPPNNGYNKAFRSENIHCSICFSETCSNNICMQAIQPGIIIEAMKELLGALAVDKKTIPA